MSLEKQWSTSVAAGSNVLLPAATPPLPDGFCRRNSGLRVAAASNHIRLFFISYGAV